MKIYRIRDTKTGLFSKGGYGYYFTKNGKVWTTRGALKTHLTRVAHGGRYNPDLVNARLDSWEVIEYDLDAAATATFSARTEAYRPVKK